MIHPVFCYLFIALSFAISFALFVPGKLDDTKYFYLPIVLLIAFYTLYAFVTDRQVYQKRKLWQSLLIGTLKYVLWGLAILGVIALYQHHPTYKDMTPNTRHFFKHFFYVYAMCAWPYFFLADRYRTCVSNVLVDPFYTIAVLVKCLLRGRFDLFRRRLATRQMRRLVVSAFLRVHFIPVMFEQVYLGVVDLSVPLQALLVQFQDFIGVVFFTLPSTEPTIPIVVLLIAFFWLVDSNNASIGYFWESRFTKTFFRDVDPHPSHWIVTLACYLPFIYFVKNFVVEFPALANNSHPLFDQATLNTVIDWTMAVVLMLYMLSGSALSFSFSNLSYKRIQTRGPYRFVRHPSITFKIIFFTLAFYRFAPAWTWSWFLCYISWMGIYVCRAFVEERFLRRFPDYQAYMQQTRYRFIPGII